ncbi:LysO family transporter [Serratia ureilytica]
MALESPRRAAWRRAASCRPGRGQWLQFAHGAANMRRSSLLLVGIQLRGGGMTLRQIALNRRGTLVALVDRRVKLAGGVLAAQLLGLPVKAGLAMASGFGLVPRCRVTLDHRRLRAR